MPNDGQWFSERSGYDQREPAQEITVREAAPVALLEAVINIAATVGHIDCDELLQLASDMQLQREPWKPAVVRAGEPSRVTLRRWFVEEWPWYRFYDFIECIYVAVRQGDGARDERALKDAFFQEEFTSPEPLAAAFQRDVNRYFLYAGVGWQLVDGTIRSRGTEVFEHAVGRAMEELEVSGLQTANAEIHEALQDLSRRPKPDLSGAIHHGVGALECVARHVTREPKATLGKILEKHPNLLPQPLDKALSQVWGYASEKARHVREGNEPGREESELIVGLAAATVVYLIQKLK